LKEALQKQINHTFKGIDYISNSSIKLNHGKVRDYFFHDNKIVMVTSDRLSAFDRVLTTIPFKGEVLTRLSTFWLEKTKDLVPNFLLDSPYPNIAVGKQCEIVPVEVIVRNYITGSAWRKYEKGGDVSGIRFPAGLKKNQKLEQPVITPTTKAQMGLHDEEISREEILKQKLIPEDKYIQMEEMALKLFKFASEYVGKNNLILVDTKYEFGLDKEGNILVADEIHTLDSSRYWIKDTYDNCFNAGKNPDMLDKEIVRDWLLERGFSGDGEPPVIPAEVRMLLAEKYIQAYEMITGESFSVEPKENIAEEVNKVVDQLF